MPSLPPPIPNAPGPVMPPQAGVPGKDTRMAPTPGAMPDVATLFSGTNAVGMGIAILFLIVFHAGAGYLSYQKNQSAGWAFLSFLFAVFYYPYYAFTSGGSSAPAPQAMYGGLRKLLGRRR